MYIVQVLYEYQAQHGVKMINGRPRHSQSQGSVERGNKYLKHVICINHVVLTRVLTELDLSCTGTSRT